MRKVAVALLLASSAGSAEPYHLIPGGVPLDKGPDGNTIIFDAPKGLIVFDTGRHPEHARAILDYAKGRHRPIVAIINSHWHLDHTAGNWDIRQSYPHVDVYASNALEGALATFLKNGRANTDKMLADPKTAASTRDQLLRGRAVIDHPERIRPNHIIARSGPMTIAGRTFDIHLSRFAATEGDVWLYDPKSRTAVVGDLVVDIVPFMDTACAEGWSKALKEIAAVPFKMLIPGHGPVMDRTDFTAWRIAYDKFVDCGHSKVEKHACIDAWAKGAAKFIDPVHRDYVHDAADYYLTTRLRSSPEEQQRYCKPLRGS